MQLINDFPALFNDVPSHPTVLEHGINVGDAAPIKQHAYCVKCSEKSSYAE